MMYTRANHYHMHIFLYVNLAFTETQFPFSNVVLFKESKINFLIILNTIINNNNSNNTNNDNNDNLNVVFYWL